MKKALSHVTMFTVGVFCVLYLMNLLFGTVELIPDNVPFIGNLDEAAVTAILLGVMAYFGLDTSSLGRLLRAWADDRKLLTEVKKTRRLEAGKGDDA